MASDLQEYAVLLVLGFLALTFTYSQLKARKYPPGPPGIPVLGNLHRLPNDFRYKYLRKISKTYGLFTLQPIELFEVLIVRQATLSIFTTPPRLFWLSRHIARCKIYL